jgi:hypothetical protein
VSTSTITVAGQSVTLVSFPTAAGLKGYEFTFGDRIGYVPSVFTGQIGQAQQWTGADLMSATLTWAPMHATAARDVVAFLAQMRGMFCAFQVGDRTQTAAAGTVAGTPLIDNGVSGNLAGSQTVDTKGWTASAVGVLKRGEWIQFGYRMHMVLDDVTANGSGKATIPIYPSIREQPTDGGAIVTGASVKGLWRLAKNERTFSRDLTKLTRGISLPIQEYR